MDEEKKKAKRFVRVFSFSGGPTLCFFFYIFATAAAQAGGARGRLCPARSGGQGNGAAAQVCVGGVCVFDVGLRPPFSPSRLGQPSGW